MTMKEDESMLGDIPSSIVSQAIREKVLVPNSQVFTCMVCKVSMTGIIPAASHLNGVKHKKAVQMSKLDAAMEQKCDTPDATCNIVQAAIRCGEVSSHQVENVVELTCELCNKRCSGEEPMMQHLNSKLHAKAIRQRDHSSSFSSPKEVPIISRASPTQYNLASPADTQFGQEDELAQALKEGIIRAAEDDVNRLNCLVCGIFCTGKDCMREHLKGKNHLKIQKLSQQASRQSPLRSLVSNPCHSNSSQDPPSLLSDGVEHKKNTVSPITPSSTEDLSVSDEVVLEKDGVYECLVCRKTCNSHSQITSHLQGEPHKKQRRMMETALLLHQPVIAPESEKGSQTLPLSSRLKLIDFSSVIPPPSQFKVQLQEKEEGEEEQWKKTRVKECREDKQRSMSELPHCDRVAGCVRGRVDANVITLIQDSSQSNGAAKQNVKLEESGGSSVEASMSSSVKRRLHLENIKGPSRKLLAHVPDIQLYTSKDSLEDLFAE